MQTVFLSDRPSHISNIDHNLFSVREGKYLHAARKAREMAQSKLRYIFHKHMIFVK